MHGPAQNVFAAVPELSEAGGGSQRSGGNDHQSTAAELARATVFIVDQDEGFDALLTEFLIPLGITVRVYLTAAKFLAEFDEKVPGCVLVELHLPDMSGLVLQKLLKARGVSTPFLMMAARADISTAVESLRSGAADFLEKPIPITRLVDRIREAIEQDRQSRKRWQRRIDVAHRQAMLSKRERDVFQRLIMGRSTKSIAAELGISSKTVDNHRSRILEKMQAESTVDLVRQMHSLGQ